MDTELENGDPGPPSTESIFRVSGMDCGACVTKVETAVLRLPGVDTANASLSTGRLVVAHDGAADLDEIARRVRNLGYGISGATEDSLHGDASEIVDSPWMLTPKAKITLGYAVALTTAWIVGLALPGASESLFLMALLIGLVPIAKRAFAAARAGTPFSIETLMTVAAAGATAIGATGEAATVVLLFLVGEMLEGAAAGSARRNIRALTKLLPDSACVESEEGLVEVSVPELAVGMVVVVRPGDRIPADGAIVDGTSEIDEASITGESVPVPKKTGDEVFAGTINANGTLRIRVTAAAADNTISRIVRLVEEAQGFKAPTQRFIDRFSRYYTPGVLAVAAIAAVVPPLGFGEPWGEWVYKGLALLLIGCPCALVISTPAAIAAGLSAGARRGLLMKGGAVLERLRDVTVVALDKTGTITEGRPEVTEIVPLARGVRDVLSLAGAVELGSTHPLAAAIVAYAKAKKAPIPPAFDVQAVPGEGMKGSVGRDRVFLASPAAAVVHADMATAMPEIERLMKTGNTLVAVLVNGEAAGLIALRDTVRPDAADGLRMLLQRGIRALMLTGDNARVAEAVAGKLAIEARSGLLPQDKQEIVRNLQLEGEVVAKVGDGINDAPALATADIGIAMGGGSDVALDTADAAILHNRLEDISEMIDLSHRVMNTIWQNIAIALGLKGIFLVTTIAGITGLWPAILADTGATVLVTANAMRLLRARRQ
ncbi:heavy metal translocating P-type ATPase [Oricola indica]|uniref:heavy metal translocating P-type ATPase n=1 Tax=Oricola indica TaxID=2872591 RepID=UPI003CCBD2AA